MQTIIALTMLFFMVIGFVSLMRWSEKPIQKSGKKELILGITSLVISGAIASLVLIPTENYTEWERTTGSIIVDEIEDGQYVIETDTEYVYKEVRYSETGEREEKYISIKKDKNVCVDFVEMDNTEIPNYSIFSRSRKSIIGFPMSESGCIETRYIFYIPNK